MDYDYIIIGGGSSGCVLANRLSAKPQNRVLLIEAGPDTPPGQVPADVLASYHLSASNPRYRWPTLMAAMPDKRLNPHRVPYLQGRVMGGGSAVNYTVTNRGLPIDYEEWEKMGADGWSWEDVLPYFRKLETDLDFDGPMHGQDGPLPIRRTMPDKWPAVTKLVADTFAASGLGYIDDQNASFEDGHFPVAANNRNDQRVTAAMAYLDEKVRARSNLRILPQTHVKYIVIEQRRATGVVVHREGAGEERFSGGEIICSAGAIHTPPLLMRSGLGPAAHLSDMGIEVVADLPALGQNLQDHAGVAIQAFAPRGYRVFTEGSYCQVGARYSSNLPGCGVSDMYLSPMTRPLWHSVGRSLLSIATWVNQPFSTGEVKLSSPAWDAEPIIDINMLSDQRDLDRLKFGLKWILAYFDREPMRSIIREVFSTGWNKRAAAVNAINFKSKAITSAVALLMDGPEPLRRLIIERVMLAQDIRKKVAQGTERDLEEHIVRNVITIHHLSCTARMGRADDPTCVTDTQGRVRGVEGLRICDASLFPRVPRANLNVPVIMTAEKISDAILAN